MNGVTGRMGYRQHLVRSLLAIREQGGLDLGDGTRAVARAGPRRPPRARAEGARRAARPGPDWSLHRPRRRPRRRHRRHLLRRPGHLRPRGGAQEGDRGGQAHLHREADRHRPRRRPGAGPARRRPPGIKHGVVQDKLFLPGLLQAEAPHRRRLLRPDPLRPRRVRLLGLRGRLAERPAPVLELPRRGRRRHRRRHVPALGVRAARAVRPGRSPSRRTPPPTSRSRWDEQGKPYDATADDAAYGIFELDGGAVAQINSSWAVRVNRDELVEFQVDGTEGSAVAGLRNCRVQHRVGHPQAGLEPGPARPPSPSATSGRRSRTTPSSTTASRPSGSCSCGTSYADAPYHWDLLAGARGVQLAELGLKSSAEGRRLDVPELTL